MIVSKKRVSNNSVVIKKRAKPKEPYGVSIITCTSKPDFINNVFDNFNRQDYIAKELIIILNNNSMDINEFKNIAEKYRNVRVYQCEEDFSLGKCLNFAVGRSCYPYIAKFDDDDYYTSGYLNKSMEVIKKTKADIIGKATFYVYFKQSKILALRKPGRENKWDLTFLHGANLIFKKKIFKKVKFADISIGEDDQLVQDCLKNKLKVFSTDRFNYVYMRHDLSNHTSKVTEEEYLKGCKIIARTDEFLSYITQN